MRGLIALALVLVSLAAGAEDWVVVRKPNDGGHKGLPSILVDSATIVVLKDGMRRATAKTDWLAEQSRPTSGPVFIASLIVVRTYDCEKRMTREESADAHWSDGSVHALGLDGKWYPAPENKAAAPDIDFVCGWKVG